MAWGVLVVFFVGLLAAAGIWGKMSDPKQGGAYGCCGCGECVAAGECVMRKRSVQKAEKKEQDAA